MLRVFAGSENHPRHPDAQGPVVIDLGESDVFKWKMPKLVHGFIWGYLSRAHPSEQLPEFVSFHR
jgi:hypothetical protein